MRHPIERAISCVQWFRKSHRKLTGQAPPPLTAYFEGGAEYWGPDGQSAPLISSGAAEVRSLMEGRHLKFESFLHNSMTYQFGDYLDVRRRSVPASLALERAKLFLSTHVDYIGFFEDLHGTCVHGLAPATANVMEMTVWCACWCAMPCHAMPCHAMHTMACTGTWVCRLCWHLPWRHSASPP
jgi:hypothetical protein